MTRRKNLDRGRPFEIQLPDSIQQKVRAELYSEVEGRVPFGALTALGTKLFSEWLESRGIET